MTPEQFQRAISDMQGAGIIPAGHGWKTALASKLGVTRQSIDNMERGGTKQLQTDLALAALVAGLEPYS
jgi:transcriptional regulator with XRE-family HTH domain